MLVINRNVSTVNLRIWFTFIEQALQAFLLWLIGITHLAALDNFATDGTELKMASTAPE